MPNVEDLQQQIEHLMGQLATLQANGLREDLRHVETQPIDQTGCCGISTCTDCQPHRIHHWFCVTCGGGPFKFDKADPGPYRALRPQFDRTCEKYITDRAGIGRWKRWARRCCSVSCAQAELRVTNAAQLELAERRPDLAPAIVASVQSSGTDHHDSAVSAGDDLAALGIVGGGAYTPTAADSQ